MWQEQYHDIVVTFCCQKFVVFYASFLNLVSSPLDCDQNRTTTERVCTCTRLLLVELQSCFCMGNWILINGLQSATMHGKFVSCY